jgi:Ca-activated chloride channel family protein
VQDADGHFNKGNALAQAGELDAALAAYDQALEANPEMEDALFNRALVEQVKNQQQQEQDSEGEGDPGEGQPDQEGQEGEPQEQEGEQQGEGEPQESEQQSEQEGEAGQQQDLAEAWTEEDAQAMEQWLRRIPDDPGGLLRRKFRNEHQRRGAPQDEQQKW